MKKILLVLSLLGLTVSVNAIADVLPNRPFCFVACFDHPDQPKYYSHYIFDLKGAAKRVQVITGLSTSTYHIDKKGLITKITIGKMQEKYEYDSSDRLTLFRELNSKGNVTHAEEYKYIDDKNMVIQKKYDDGNWVGTNAVVRSSNNDVIYRLAASKYDSDGSKFELSQDRSTWTETYLNQNKKNDSNETNAESILLAELNCLQGSMCVNGWQVRPSKVIAQKTKEVDFDKFTSDDNGNNVALWYKNGLINEESGMHQQLSDGSYPHGIYKYQFDGKGNWIKREKYINDIPATLTDDKPKYRKVEDETVTRKIEYY